MRVAISATLNICGICLLGLYILLLHFLLRDRGFDNGVKPFHRRLTPEQRGEPRERGMRWIGFSVERTTNRRAATHRASFGRDGIGRGLRRADHVIN